MADIQNVLQAILLFTIPLLIIVASIITLTFVILRRRTEYEDPGQAGRATGGSPRLQLSYPHPRTYHTFSSASSSYAADDEGSFGGPAHRATASRIPSPTLPTIENDSWSPVDLNRGRERHSTEASLGEQRALPCDLLGPGVMDALTRKNQGEDGAGDDESGVMAPERSCHDGRNHDGGGS